MASAKLTDSDRCRAKEAARNKLGLDAFKQHQSQALDAYLRGHDVFICLPTGYGKSVVFQAAHDGVDVPKFLAIYVIVIPLKALALNHLERCVAIGLEGAVAITEIPDEVLENAGKGKYSVLFTSPEALLSEKGRELLALPSVYHRLCGLFIDESHCYKFGWDLASGNKYHNDGFLPFPT